MITYDELHTQNHDITELSNVLLYLFKDRSMCDTGACCELFHRYVGKVKEHIDLVDRNLYSKLLAHDNHDIQELARNFMSGSQEIKKIIASYIKAWCPKKQAETLAIAEHERFLKESEEMFELILHRIQNETERLYPLIKEISGDPASIAARAGIRQERRPRRDAMAEEPSRRGAAPSGSPPA
jgi:DNA replication initiation complex subunit (GINS family)